MRDENYENEEYENRRQVRKVVMLSAIGVFIIILLCCSTKNVPSGYTGVISQFGEYIKTTDNGLIFKIPFIQRVKKVDNRIKTATYEGQIWSESAEQTPVYFENVYIDYKIVPEASMDMLLQVENIKDVLNASLVSSAIKAASVQIESSKVTNRSYIEPLALAELQDAVNLKYGTNHVMILKVSIGNADFEQSYQNAIQQRQNAEIEYQTTLIENQKAIANAENQAQVSKTTAEGEATARKIQAESQAETDKIKAEADAEIVKVKAQADAEAIRVKAEAEAEANAKLAASYDANVLTHEYYQAWDGKLPETVLSDGANSEILFMK